MTGASDIDNAKLAAVALVCAIVIVSLFTLGPPIR